MKMFQHGISSRINTVEEEISEHEDIETIFSSCKKEVVKRKKTRKEKYSMTLSNLVYM